MYFCKVITPVTLQNHPLRGTKEITMKSMLLALLGVLAVGAVLCMTFGPVVNTLINALSKIAGM